MSQTSRTRIEESPLTTNFLSLCQRIREFLEEQVQRETSGLPLAESLERMPEGGLCVRSQLPTGITFLAHPTNQAPVTAILRIFFDPSRFRAWCAAMGPMSFAYMDPHSIELILDEKTKQWRLYLDRQELYLDLEADEVYELARLEIEDGHVFRTK